MTTLSFLISGIALGFTQGCSPGPHSALVISQTLTGGFRRGITVAFAPVVATIPILAITLPLASILTQYPNGLAFLAFVGAIYLIYLAWDTFKVSAFAPSDTTSIVASPFWKGFNAALLSPHPYLFWSTAGAALLLSAYPAGVLSAAVFLVGFLGMFFIVKLGIAALASQLKMGIGGNGLAVFMRGLSFVFLGFALWLVIDGLKLLGVIL